MSDDPKIPGFIEHGDKYRAHVTVERAVAFDVADEAKERGVKVSEVLRERVSAGPARRRKGLGRKGVGA